MNSNLLKASVLIYLTLMGFTLLAQKKDAVMNFTVKDHPEQMYWLFRYYATDRLKLDSTNTDDAGKGVFNLKSSYDHGMYRIQDNKGEGIDFLNLGENIEMVGNNGYYLSGIEVTSSKGNQEFFTYLKSRDSYSTRIDLLGNLMVYYPADDSFYYKAESHYIALSAEYNAYIRDQIASYKGTLLGTIMMWDQLPDIDPGILAPEQKSMLKEKYFDEISWGDTLILYTPLLPVKVIDYLSLYVEQGANKERQEASFTEAVDKLVGFASVNNTVKEAIVNYMIQGFQAYGFENIITHIVEKYIAGQSCVSDQEEAKLVKRVEGFKKLAVGNQAADISLPDKSGNMITLSSLKSDYYLLVFWASWCPHCSEMLPQLDAAVGECFNKSAIGSTRYAVGGESIEVVYISIDTDAALWQKALAEKGLGGIHLCDQKGWDGSAAQDYYLYATPTLIILDKDRKILSKPMGVVEVKEFMTKNGVCR